MNPTAIYSKSGKGVQEASGKTSNLSRADRAVLSAFDGRLTVADVAERVGKPFDAKFEQIIAQLDKDGYIREVSSGASAAKPAPGRPAPAAAKPAAAPAKPAAAPGEDLDFTLNIPASPAPKPPPPKAAAMAPAAAARAETEKKAQEDNMARARREAEERQHKERDRIKAETEAKLRVETEAKMRSEAAQKAKADAEKAKKDAEEKIRAETEAKVKAASEAAVKAAFEAERKAKEETDRIRKEAEEKARKEAAELQRKLDEERRAREEAERARQEAERKAREAAEKARQEAERKAKEEADRIRREAEEKARKEAAELQRKLDEERRAREEAERARQEAERRAREESERAKKEAERGAREQAEREQQEAERESRELADRLRREQEDSHAATVRAAQQAEQAARELIEAQAEHAKQQEKDKEAAKGKGDGGFDSLLADLDSFSDREDEDRKAKEEADRKAKEDGARRLREEAEAKAREEGARKQREAAELERQLEDERKKEEATRKAREEQEARERREEEERKAEEKKRKRREEALAKEATTEKSDDIGVSDDDLGMDDVKADEEQVSKESRKAARAREREAKEREQEARERAREREREAKRAVAGPAAAPVGGYRPLRRRRNWGKPIALTLFVALLAGVGYLHVMPVNTQPYEKAASDAIGIPVRVGTARLSVYRGLVLNLENISVGDMRIPAGHAYPEIGSLFDEKKVLTRLDLDGVTLPQEAVGALLNVKLHSDKFYVARLTAGKVKLPGALPLPVLDAEVTVGPQGSISTIELRGPDNLVGKLTPRGADIDFEATASGFTIPFLPDVTLSTFAMKGRANLEGARIESWGGAIVGGAVNGNANVRWAGGTWNLDGTMTLRGINAATFAPALLSDGNAEGTARFSMSDPDPSKFKQRGRVEGSFIMNRGVLGSFDLSRAILTGGRQATGRTPFIELNGQGVYDRGAVTLRNVTFAAGAMNATANADISPEGALSGRIVADIKTAAQQLRATINVGGTVGEPQVK